MGTVGATFALADRLRHLVLPAATLGVVMVATWSRYTRASMLEVIGEDYIRTARAKGVAQGGVILKHALRNALIPLVTLAGLQLPLVFSGALVTETVFTWPGMGRLFVDSIGYRDYPVLMGILMLTAALVVLGNLLADLVYAAIDPRVRSLVSAAVAAAAAPAEAAAPGRSAGISGALRAPPARRGQRGGDRAPRARPRSSPARSPARPAPDRDGPQVRAAPRQGASPRRRRARPRRARAACCTPGASRSPWAWPPCS